MSALISKNTQTNNGRPLALDPFFRSVRSVSGIGPKNAPLFESLCGLYLKDLLFHTPSGFVDRSYTPPVREAENGRVGTFELTIIKHFPSHHKSRPYRVRTQDKQGTYLDLVFFSARKTYLEKILPIDEKRIISGQVDFFQGQAQIAHPDFIVTIDKADEIIGYETLYPLTTGLSTKLVRKAILNSLKETPTLPEWLTPELLKQEKWPSFNNALQALHQPQSNEDTSPEYKNRQRLAYDELLANQLTLALNRSHNKKRTGHSLKTSTKLKEKLQNALPFTLTKGQETALLEINEDMLKPEQMLRLLQGDVGSGKTIVALFACLNAIENNKQCAFMAPTEILARQHYTGLADLCELLNLKTAILTGQEKGKKRESLLQELSSGVIDIVFGTHALFQDSVAFHDLGLAIIDEQHRFGVEQRIKLSNKGVRPDILAMTATPIPRTLTLTAYGDMDVSLLKDKPEGRKDIDTRLVSIERLDDLTKSLKDKIKQDERIYWVCPLIEESKKLDLAAAEDRFNALVDTFGKETVGLVHGRMKAEEKQNTMNKFKSGALKILVSTTVIEVGVNVPEATIMIIEHAERFGLSQLHQLRGRVGRGDKQSTCILLYPKQIGHTAKDRLNAMRESNDGFYLAEKDLELRGAGEILGTRQSGMVSYKLANPAYHQDLISMAYKEARLITEKDPYLISDRGKNLRMLLYLFEQDQALKYLRSG